MDTDTYTVGSIASFLASSSAEKSATPSENQKKLAELFSSPPSAHNKKVPAKQIPSKKNKNSESLQVKKRKSKQNIQSNSSTLIQREESLRNADEVSQPKKNKKIKLQSPPEVTDENTKSEDPTVKSPKKSKNLTNAERRVKLKALKPEIKEKKLKNERTVFVGNVALTVDKKTLLRLFKSCGKVEAVRVRSVPVASLKMPKKALVIKKEFHPSRHNMNAYVIFEDTESAKAALKLNGHELCGLHIRVDLANSRKQHDHKKSIFVGNLPFDIEEEKLRSHFDDCGKIENIRIVRDKTTGVGKGFGFIKFEDESSVDDNTMICDLIRKFDDESSVDDNTMICDLIRKFDDESSVDDNTMICDLIRKFDDKSSVDLALSLEGQDFHGRKLRIQRSSEKQKSKVKSNRSAVVKKSGTKPQQNSSKSSASSVAGNKKRTRQAGDDKKKNKEDVDKTRTKLNQKTGKKSSSSAPAAGSSRPAAESRTLDARKKQHQRKKKILRQKIKEKIKLSLGKLLTKKKN